MFCGSKKKKPHQKIDMTNPFEKRRFDLGQYEIALKNIRTQMTVYHKSLNGVIGFYRNISEQFKLFYDKECIYRAPILQAAECFSTSADLLSEQVRLLLTLGDSCKDWIKNFENQKPFVKSFDVDLKKKNHYIEKMENLKRNKNIIEAKGMILTKKQTARLLRVTP